MSIGELPSAARSESRMPAISKLEDVKDSVRPEDLDRLVAMGIANETAKSMRVLLKKVSLQAVELKEKMTKRILAEMEKGKKFTTADIIELARETVESVS